MQKAEITKILIHSSLLRNALQSWSDYLRSIDPKFNQTTFANQLGFHSKGSFSDILSGRRAFPQNKIDALATFLQLNSDETEYLNLLWQIEREIDAEKSEEIYKQLAKLGEFLDIASMSISNQLKNNTFAIDVYTSIGIFDNSADLEDLILFFGREKIFEIQKALQLLLHEGIIERINQKFRITTQKIVVKDTLLSGTEGLINSLNQAAKAIPTINELEYISINQIVACNHKVLKQKLEAFRNELIKISMTLAVEKGNTMAKLIGACYPISFKNLTQD